MQASEARRLRELERKTARLKRLLAERDLEIDAMKELLAKKWCAHRSREAVRFLHGLKVSQRRGCALLKTGWSSYRYVAHPREDGPLTEKLREVARKYPRYGYRRAWALLFRAGEMVTPSGCIGFGSRLACYPPSVGVSPGLNGTVPYHCRQPVPTMSGPMILWRTPRPAGNCGF
jgi:hypothetical protein